jgi:hypothetical protein
VAKKSDNTLLLLLLCAGGALLLSNKSSAVKAPALPPIDEDDVEHDAPAPRGNVTIGPPTIVHTPDIPEGVDLSERSISDPTMNAARAAAAAADAAARQKAPLYPSIPSSNQPHEAIPPAQATLDQVPAPAGLHDGSDSAPGPNLPAGYDPAAARRGARALAAHLKRAGRANYDRRLLEQWQRQAGLMPDRIYAGGTRGALLAYGVKSAEAPAPFFKPFETIPYVPPEKR